MRESKSFIPESSVGKCEIYGVLLRDDRSDSDFTRYEIVDDMARIEQLQISLVFQTRQEALDHIRSNHPARPNFQRVFDIGTVEFSRYVLVSTMEIAITEYAARLAISEIPRVRSWPVVHPHLANSKTKKNGFPVFSVGARRNTQKNASRKVQSQSSFNLDLTGKVLGLFNQEISRRLAATTTYHRDRIVILPESSNDPYVRHRIPLPEVYSPFMDGHGRPVNTRIALPRGSKRGMNTPMELHNSGLFYRAQEAAVWIIAFTDVMKLLEPRRGSRQPRREILRDRSVGALAHHLNCCMRNRTACIEAKEMISALHVLMTRRLRVTGIHPLPEEYPPCPPIPTLTPRPVWHCPRRSFRTVRKSPSPATSTPGRATRKSPRSS